MQLSTLAETGEFVEELLWVISGVDHIYRGSAHEREVSQKENLA